MSNRLQTTPVGSGGKYRGSIAGVAAASLLFLLYAILILTAAGKPALANHGSKQPNILLIVTDDQRFRTTVEALGANTSDYTMPNLRRWFYKDAAGNPQGTLFQWAFVTTPECCPSRASIFTGRYAHNHGVHTVLAADAYPPGAGEVPGAEVLDQSTTVQNYLQTNGYYTGIYGKYLNGWDLSKPPEAFDTWGIFGSGYGNYDDCNSSTSVPKPDPDHCLLYASEPNGTGGTTVIPQSIYSTQYVRDKALSFLAQRQNAKLGGNDQPWFLYLAPYAPHAAPHHPASGCGANPCNGADIDSPHPLWAHDKAGVSVPDPTYISHPDSYFEGFSGTDPDLGTPYDSIADKPGYVRNWPTIAPQTTPQPRCCKRSPSAPKSNTPADVQAERAGHIKSLKSVDDMIGDVMSEIQADSEDNDTLVIFISDNGVMWGEHSLEGKLVPYTESVRVPMFMRWPGHAGVAGSNLPNVDTRLVASIDIAPTLLAAAGIQQDPPDLNCFTGDFRKCNIMDGMSLLGSAATWRRKLLLEYWNAYGPTPGTESAEPVPSWTSLRTAWSNSIDPAPSYQYTEYTTDTYAGDGDDNGFREYYNLKPNVDPNQKNNLLANGGSLPPEGSDAPTLLQTYRNCAGPQGAPAPGHAACP